MKLLVLTRFGDQGASSRMRVLQYERFFEAAGIETSLLTLFENEDLSHRYASGKHSKFKVVQRYFRRIWGLIRDNTSIVWIEKELMPWMPAWFEKLLLFRRRYVLDFDDAIFHNYDLHRIGVVRALYGRKIDRLMRGAALVLAGNDYLADRARQAGCPRVEIVPTVIDLERYPLTEYLEPTASEEFVVGWIGSPSTTKYLQQLANPLARLSLERKVRFRVIGARRIEFSGVQIEQLNWKESEEASMLAGCDCGVMPLDDSPWERGKCGYKLIQYMASAKPVVGSPIGVNCQIVRPENGFLCSTESEWYSALSQLAAAPNQRRMMGLAGRRLVEECYSIQSTGPIVAAYLKQVAGLVADNFETESARADVQSAGFKS